MQVLVVLLTACWLPALLFRYMEYYNEEKERRHEETSVDVATLAVYLVL